MKVVVDTNVFISSFLGRGAPRELINKWKDGLVTLCLTQEILDEYMDVFERLDLINEPEFGEILQLFASGYYIDFRTSVPAIDVIKVDTTDNKFLAAAIAMKAEYIISGDKHLKVLKRFLRTDILSPRQFLDLHKS